jgi:hypothetical protein
METLLYLYLADAEKAELNILSTLKLYIAVRAFEVLLI